eukprot:768799-Hanusia_phi.AAC.3
MSFTSQSQCGLIAPLSLLVADITTSRGRLCSRLLPLLLSAVRSSVLPSLAVTSVSRAVVCAPVSCRYFCQPCAHLSSRAAGMAGVARKLTEDEIKQQRKAAVNPVTGEGGIGRH